MSDDAHLLAELIRAAGEALRRDEQRLCDLDAAVGDGDHGHTMVRCWELVEREAAHGAASVADVLERAGRAVVAQGGGATGPLLGTALIAAGRTPDDGDRSTRAATMLTAAADEISRRGGALLGDRTLLDALAPAAVIAHQVAATGMPLAEVMGVAATVAEDGAAATADLVARVGRATRLGEQAIGHPDPGAVSVAVVLRAAAERLQELAAADAEPS